MSRRQCRTLTGQEGEGSGAPCVHRAHPRCGCNQKENRICWEEQCLLSSVTGSNPGTAQQDQAALAPFLDQWVVIALAAPACLNGPEQR